MAQLRQTLRIGRRTARLEVGRYLAAARIALIGGWRTRRAPSFRCTCGGFAFSRWRLAWGGLRRWGGRGVYRVVLQATCGAGGRRWRTAPPAPQEPLGSHNQPLACRQERFPYEGKQPAGGVLRCARRLSPNTGRARSIRRRPSESVRCDRPSANLEVS